jgi:hypothetical protein
VSPIYPHARMTRSRRFWRRRRHIRQILWSLVAVIATVVSLLAAVPATANATPSNPSKPSSVVKGKSIPVAPVASHYTKPKPLPAWKPGPVVWPTGSATISLTAPPTGTPTTPPPSTSSLATPRTAAAPSTAHAPQASTTQPSPATTPAKSAASPPQTPPLVTAPVKAGNLPVWVAPAPATKTPANTSPSSTPPSPPTAVQVTASPHQTATAVGIAGSVVSLRRTDGSTSSGNVTVSLGYGGYANAYGGDWASRLRLVTLPPCALSTPQKPACRTTTDVPFTRDSKAQTLTGTVTLPATAPASKSAPSIVLATESSASGGGSGDYTATSLKPSGSWQAGGSADAFTWSYPITVPPVPGGLEPKVQLSYDSQSVDGLTSTTNNQASWLGDGWSYEPGFVEQSFQSCEQNQAPLPKTGDQCWSSNDTLTLSLDGSTTTLIPAGTDSNNNPLYRAENDSNERIQQVGGPNLPGNPQTEYFVVTTDDGTQYYFGLNKLHGWQDGDPVTNSVWTEPVYAPLPGQACYNSNFADASCSQDYRWNLDYVVDPHHDAVSYYYTPETNYYAADNSQTANASYFDLKNGAAP